MEDRLESLVPRPRTAHPLPGEFCLRPDTQISAGPGAEEAAAAVRRAFASLPQVTAREDGADRAAAVRDAGEHGLPDGAAGADGGRPGRADHRAGGAVTVHLDRKLGGESYRLTVRPELLRIEAGGPPGAFYAAQTAAQMLPDDVWRRAPVPGLRLVMPCAQIEDGPALAWRGAHLDVARHFFPKRNVLGFIDQLAAHKLNRFHLHLTDDQGWRIESRRYPRLNEVASWRPRTVTGIADGTPRYDEVPHGGYYTLGDLAEIAAYAAERMVTIVPEIDIPGHSSALLAALPWLGARPGAAYQVATEWGVFPAIMSPLPQTLGVLEEVFGELLGVMPPAPASGPAPSRYLHIGGDECVLNDWRENAAIEDYRRSLGLSTPKALHVHFLRHVADMLAGSFGCRAIVWDEGFVSSSLAAAAGQENQLRPDTVVMAWRGMHIARQAAGAGLEVVAAPRLPTYFDSRQAGGVSDPRGRRRRVRLEDVAGFAPVPPGWPGQTAGRLIGTQFQLWSENIPDPRSLDFTAFPRGCLFAEVAWTGRPLIGGEPGTMPGSGDLAGHPELRRRLAAHLRRLDAAGVEYRPLDGPHPWQQDL